MFSRESVLVLKLLPLMLLVLKLNSFMEFKELEVFINPVELSRLDGVDIVEAVDDERILVAVDEDGSISS